MSASYSYDTNREIQIGLIVLQADETIETDMRRLLPPAISCLVSRVPSGEVLSPETLRTMEKHLTGAADLLPKGASFSAVGYACTSGTAEIGSARIAELVRSGAATPEVTEPVSALIAACAALDVSRIALLSPYVPSVSDRLVSVLADAGIEVPIVESFDEDVEARVVRISQDSVLDAAKNIGKLDDYEAIFLSCTNLRTLSVIDKIEVATGKPVLSSNQVLAWHMCRLANAKASQDAPGKLFRL